MQNVRRYFKEGNIYFLTHVTYNRLPILIKNIDLWWNALKKHKVARNPCGSESLKIDHAPTLLAWVILPDHIHMIINPANKDLSQLMKKIKLSFAAHYHKRMGLKSGRVWQNRYWDHIIRNQADFNRHVDYIHYNPVKHGLSSSAAGYPHSSFEEYCKTDYYRSDWTLTKNIEVDIKFGE